MYTGIESSCSPGCAASRARWALEQALDRPEGEAGDCADVLVQVAAVRGAAHSLLMELLHEHLQEHVVGADDPQQRADEAEVLVELLRRYGK